MLIITVHPQYGLTVINCFNSGFGVTTERVFLIGYCAWPVNTAAAEEKEEKEISDRKSQLHTLKTQRGLPVSSHMIHLIPTFSLLTASTFQLKTANFVLHSFVSKSVLSQGSVSFFFLLLVFF